MISAIVEVHIFRFCDMFLILVGWIYLLLIYFNIFTQLLYFKIFGKSEYVSAMLRCTFQDASSVNRQLIQLFYLLFTSCKIKTFCQTNHTDLKNIDKTRQVNTRCDGFGYLIDSLIA